MYTDLFSLCGLFCIVGSVPLHFYFTDCNNMVINDGAFAYMTGMTLLTFFAGSFTSISSSAFTGMTSLTTLYIYGTMPSTGVPSGLFSGLTALTTLDMSRTNMVRYLDLYKYFSLSEKKTR